MNEPQSEHLRIEYIKSNLFRVVHADGAFGGISPRLDLFITFYSERFPIPKVLTYEMTPSGATGQEIQSERETKAGVIREVEIGVMLDLLTAKSLAEWLNGKIAELEKARGQVLASETQLEEITK